MQIQNAQTVRDLLKGKSYTLTFKLGTTYNTTLRKAAKGGPFLSVTMGNQTVFNATDGAPIQKWTKFSGVFTATAKEMTLTFSTFNPKAQFLLSNVMLSAPFQEEKSKGSGNIKKGPAVIPKGLRL